MLNNFDKIDDSKVYVRRKAFLFGYIVLILYTILVLSWPLFIADCALFLFLHSSVRVYYLENGKKKKIVISRVDWKQYCTKNQITALPTQFSYTAVKKHVESHKNNAGNHETPEETQEIIPEPRVTEEEVSPKPSFNDQEQEIVNNEVIDLDSQQTQILETQNTQKAQIKSPKIPKSLAYKPDRIHKPKNIDPLPTLDDEDEATVQMPQFSYSSMASEKNSSQYKFEFNYDNKVIVTSIGTFNYEEIKSSSLYLGPKTAGLIISLKDQMSKYKVPISEWKQDKIEEIYNDLKTKLESIYQIIEENNISSLSNDKKEEYLKLKEQGILINFGNANFGIDLKDEAIFLDQLYLSKGYKLIKFANIQEFKVDNESNTDNTQFLKIKVLFNHNEESDLILNKYATPSFNLNTELDLENKVYQELSNIKDHIR